MEIIMFIQSGNPNRNAHSGVGDKLSEILFERDMKRTELAEAMGEDPSVISAWIHGRRTISDEKKEKLSKILNIPYTELQLTNCTIDIKGSIEDNYTVIDYDNNASPRRLKLKNILVPEDVYGYIYNPTNTSGWRSGAIYCVRIMKGRWVDSKIVSSDCDGRFSFVKTQDNKKMFGVPIKKADGLYDICAMSDGQVFARNVELEYGLPVLCCFFNWMLMERSFYDTLD
mgnify:CR=1 FL=1